MKKWHLMIRPGKLLILISIIFLLLTTESVSALSLNELQNQRINVLKQYVTLLGQGNFKALPELFTTDALAISSSGVADHPVHFYQALFTNTISKPNASMINIFEGKLNPNMMAAYFNFSWQNMHGKIVAAKFLDLFIFEDGTSKIKNIFIFSNTFKEDIMKQLQ